jgi:hypothetical protein
VRKIFPLGSISTSGKVLNIARRTPHPLTAVDRLGQRWVVPDDVLAAHRDEAFHVVFVPASEPAQRPIDDEVDLQGSLLSCTIH